jgi:hypothetical protein
VSGILDCCRIRRHLAKGDAEAAGRRCSRDGRLAATFAMCGGMVDASEHASQLMACTDDGSLATWKAHGAAVPLGPGQYTSGHLQWRLKGRDTTCRMSRAGKIWDPSALERFFSSLKAACMVRKVYRSREQAPHSCVRPHRAVPQPQVPAFGVGAHHSRTAREGSRSLGPHQGNRRYPKPACVPTSGLMAQRWRSRPGTWCLSLLRRSAR